MRVRRWSSKAFAFALFMLACKSFKVLENGVHGWEHVCSGMHGHVGIMKDLKGHCNRLSIIRRGLCCSLKQYKLCIP